MTNLYGVLAGNRNQQLPPGWLVDNIEGLVKRNIQTYGSDDQTYIDVTINVYMQRRALYYVFNIIIPCMIMSVMALLVFTLPPEANEKIVLGVTTLLSLTMLLQLVGDKLPQTSSGNPVLVLYFTCTMILCSLSLVCAVVLLNCHHHTGGIVYVPWWVETLINTWLASLLRIDHNSPEENLYAPKEKLLPKHRVNSNLTDCNENTSLYNKSSIGRIKPNKASRESKTLTNDSRDESLNSPTKNTPVWSNVIDVNSEFRPAVLIHRTVAPQLNSPQHTGVVVKQNHFIEPLQQQQVKLRNLSTRQLNRFFSQEEEDDEEEAAAAAGGMRSGVSSRLEYACNRSASMKYGYSNKENIRMSIPANTTNAINGQLIKSTKYLDKTLPRSHIPSACASMTSSASASASPSSPSSSSSLTESRINPSPEKLKQWSDTLLFSSPSKTDDLSFSSPLKQDSYQTRDNQIIASSDTDDLLLLKLKQISKELRFITSGMHIRDQEVKTSNQWRLACRVLDRFCLLVFAALNLFTTLGILTSAPTVIKAFTFKGEPSRPM
ncbi:unnamed protein product [Trichobilharzia regenti]|nr:unnamed protein product [Trichobilharzia regenti]